MVCVASQGEDVRPGALVLHPPAPSQHIPSESSTSLHGQHYFLFLSYPLCCTPPLLKHQQRAVWSWLVSFAMVCVTSVPPQACSSQHACKRSGRQM